MKLQILSALSFSHTKPHKGGWLVAYREQVVVSVAAALFLRFFLAGLSTLSLGSSVRMRCGVLVLKSAWPLTWPGFLIWRSCSSSKPTETATQLLFSLGVQGPRKQMRQTNSVYVFSFYCETQDSFPLQTRKNDSHEKSVMGIAHNNNICAISAWF